jgi:hypothetical protein
MIWISDKLEARSSPIEGKGLFVITAIEPGEVVFDMSVSKLPVISGSEAEKRYEQGFDYMLQIGDDAFAVTRQDSDPVEYGYVNHSCNPNCGIKNLLQFVSMRKINPGEEITFDYAMTESSDYSFKCHCGSSNCRGIITGNDWKIPQLQQRYGRYFSDYLLKKF